MTTQEMHIEIDLELQKINSQITKNILPQEKDWFLNKEVIKYLQSKVNPTSNIKKLGFEDTAKRVEDIRDFIRSANKPIETNSQGKQFIPFPSDYFGYIRFDSLAYKDCENVIVVPTLVPYYKTTFIIELPSNTLDSYIINLVTSNGTTKVFDIDDLPDKYLTNSEFKKQEFLLHQALKIRLKDTIAKALSPDIELYWELNAYDYNSISFTLESIVPFSSVNVVTNGTGVVNTVTTVSKNIVSASDTSLKAKIRLIDDEYLTDAENSHLSKSRPQSPIGAVREGVLELSKISGAIYGSVNITYICVPNKIDLLLNSNLNVSDKVAKEIVSNTVRTLKGILETRDYQTYAQENILTE